jgi:ABC-type taurine transport system substrate-binding protein
MGTPFYSYSVRELFGAGTLADAYAAPSTQRPNDITSINSSVINVATVAIAPALPTAGDLNTTIRAAQSRSEDSIRLNGQQDTGIYVSLLETLDDAGDLSSFMIRPNPLFWFGNIQIIMNGLTDAQRTTITNLDIGSQISVTKTFPKSTPSTVTQLMALEGISHDISPDRHIVTLYTNPARIYTYFIVGGYPLTTRTNLVANPNFEVNTTGWGVDAGVTLTRSTADFYSGVASGLLSNTIAGQGINNLSNRQPASAGLSYTASAYIKKASGVNFDYSIRLFFYDAGGSILSAPLSGEYTIGSGWERQSVTATSPANTTTIGMQVLRRTVAGAANFYVDALLIEAASSALPYFDGANADPYTGFALNSKAWTGTANASTSVGTWYQGATRTNLAENPNFEINADYWTPAAVTLTRITSAAYIGTACLQMSSPTAGDVTARTAYDPNTSIGAGVELTASCYVYNFAGNNRGHRMDIRCFNSGGSVIQTFTGTVTTVNVGSGWTRLSVTGTTPALTTSVDAVVFCQTTNTSASNVTYVDAVLVERASSALPYFDGTYVDTYSGYTLINQAWNGTANLSTSTANWGLTSAFIGSQIGDDTKGLG